MSRKERIERAALALYAAAIADRGIPATSYLKGDGRNPRLVAARHAIDAASVFVEEMDLQFPEEGT